jgi:multicomponent Na+:H+ antiporter subunit C
MTSIHVYALCGSLLFGLGFWGVMALQHFLRKVIGLNVMGAGVFLILIAFAHRETSPFPDPVPHAMVLTGIVVAISATALALVIIRRLFRETGLTTFPKARVKFRDTHAD